MNRRQLHMMTALMWSKQSKCRRTGNGALITNQAMTRIFSFGYNGPAHGLPNDRCRNVAGDCGCLHAECNALLKCGDHQENKILFCTTLPCEQCAQMVINHRLIYEVYYLVRYRDPTGEKLLYDAGLGLTQVSQSELLRAFKELSLF